MPDLISDKAYVVTIEGRVPIELASLPQEELAQVILSAFTVGLVASATVVSSNCKLLQLAPQQNLEPN